VYIVDTVFKVVRIVVFWSCFFCSGQISWIVFDAVASSAQVYREFDEAELDEIEGDETELEEDLKKPRRKNVLLKLNTNVSSKHPGLTKTEPPGMS
jgi:hypothetical protein